METPATQAAPGRDFAERPRGVSGAAEPLLTKDTITTVQDEPIEPRAALEFVSAPGHGGQCLFLGVVRNLHEGKAVEAVEYDGFKPLASKVLDQIAAEAVEQWGVRVAAFHRLGRLKVGETSLAVAAGSEHRDAAFAACRYVVEELKRRLPVWKKERFADGREAWLDGCALAKTAEAAR